MRDNPPDARRLARLRVGRNVRHLRRLRGFSQEQLAELVGNTDKHIGQVERGEVNVGIDILLGIASALSVNVADLFAGVHTADARARVVLIPERELDRLEQSLQAIRALRRSNPPARRRG
ncbi:MAG: helix-turn-helix domain-containing protein [Acidobacteria bacterium]|nr:helix-turn-helix domain-containing protein [Acidobacteriota bacterium]